MHALLKPSLNWLLVFVPIAGYLEYFTKAHTWIFLTACVAVIPLAGWMGKATEHLAEKTGDGIGGLLNATFGNAAELIIALVALSKGPQMHEVVKASITGSIIGNILLVLGAAAFAGGLKHKTLSFNARGAQTYATMLLLAAAALVLPAMFHVISGGGSAALAVERDLSLEIAIVLIITYALSLVFSLRTHRNLFVAPAAESAAVESAAVESAAVESAAVESAAVESAAVESTAVESTAFKNNVLTPGAEITASGNHPTTTSSIATAPTHHDGTWSVGKSLSVLIGATVVIAVIAEWLVGSVTHAAHELGMTNVFVGVIVVAIVGNAAEHSTAVLVAMKKRMDLAIGVAAGSSIQVALFVAPVLVFASYAMGPVPLDLVFSPAEVMAIVLAVLVVAQVTNDGETNWLEGVQLLSLYLILAFVFYWLPDPSAHLNAATPVTK